MRACSEAGDVSNTNAQFLIEFSGLPSLSLSLCAMYLGWILCTLLIFWKNLQRGPDCIVIKITAMHFLCVLN